MNTSSFRATISRYLIMEGDNSLKTHMEQGDIKPQIHDKTHSSSAKSLRSREQARRSEEPKMFKLKTVQFNVSVK